MTVADSVPVLVPQDDAGRKRKDAYLKRTYGITLADFEQLLEFQDYRCAVCTRAFVKTPHVDHAHSSGVVRGLLCFYCNHKRVGRETSAAMMYAVAVYLERPPAVEVLGERIAPPKKSKRRRPRKRA